MYVNFFSFQLFSEISNRVILRVHINIMFTNDRNEIDIIRKNV